MLNPATAQTKAEGFRCSVHYSFLNPQHRFRSLSHRQGRQTHKPTAQSVDGSHFAWRRCSFLPSSSRSVPTIDRLSQPHPNTHGVPLFPPKSTQWRRSSFRDNGGQNPPHTLRLPLRLRNDQGTLPCLQRTLNAASPTLQTPLLNPNFVRSFCRSKGTPPPTLTQRTARHRRRPDSTTYSKYCQHNAFHSYVGRSIQPTQFKKTSATDAAKALSRAPASNKVHQQFKDFFL